jgi:hypothetical protein
MTENALAAEANRLQQYEIVWVQPFQYSLPDRPQGFGLEIEDFLGPGDPDHRGEPTVWVRGPVLTPPGTPSVTIAIPHDQPRVRRIGGRFLPPETAR